MLLMSPACACAWNWRCALSGRGQADRGLARHTTDDGGECEPLAFEDSMTRAPSAYPLPSDARSIRELVWPDTNVEVRWIA